MSINKVNISFGVSQIPEKMSSNLCVKSRDFLVALQNLNPDLQKLEAGKDVYGVKKTVKSLKELTNMDCILKDGVVFKDGDKKIKFTSPDNYTLFVEEQSSSGTRDVQIRYNRLTKANDNFSESFDLEKFLTETFDKFDFIFLQIKKFFLSKDVKSIMEKLTPHGVFKGQSQQYVKDIKDLFIQIQDELSTVTNPASHSKIKNSYPLIKKGKHRSKQIEFEKVGYAKENYSVNIMTGRDRVEYLLLQIIEENKNPQYLFIKPDGEVIKEIKFNHLIKTGEKTTYYSQRELDSPLLEMHLKKIKEELEKYKQYIQNTIQKREEIKKHLSTGEIGCIDKESLYLITVVKKLFDDCKTRIVKIKDAGRKRDFKKKYKIDTIMSSPSLLLRDITPAHESIHISFPVFKNKMCTKIIILGQNDKIKKSLFVSDDKMIKFNAPSLKRSKRNDTVTNYHSQQEIDESGLKDYLLMAKERLEAIPPIQIKK